MATYYKHAVSLLSLGLIASVLMLSACEDDDNKKSRQLDIHNLGNLYNSLSSHATSVKTGDTAQLDAHTSHCSKTSQDSTATFHWAINDFPDTSSATLDNADSAIASIDTDVDGFYTADLTLTCAGIASDAITYTVFASSTGAPVVLQPKDQHVKINTLVHIQRLSIIHPNSQGVTVTHTVTDPKGGTVTTAASSVNAQGLAMPDGHATFTPASTGDYTVTSLISDGSESSTVKYRVIVTQPTTNAMPIAEAGLAQTVERGHAVTLHGNGSHDIDNDTLTYQWSISTKPTGSSVANTGTGADFTFTPDLEGVYAVKLVVNDGTVDSSPDFASITATAVTPSQSDESRLVQFGLDQTDAHYLVANHSAAVQQVLAKSDGVFYGVTVQDSFFKDSTDPSASIFSGYTLGNWQLRHKTFFKKMFGRIKFVANTTDFETAFNNQISLLDSSHQGGGTPYPSTYTQFVTQVTDAITTDSGQFKFFLSESETGVAHGTSGLILEVERPGMMGDPNSKGKVSKLDETAPLVFHELTHSVGFLHEPNDATTTLKPNNIPYYVQTIVGYDAFDIVGGYCKGDPACPSYSLTAGYPNALLTKYFGAPK